MTGPSTQDSPKVPMFKTAAGTWSQFDNPDHERRTRESGEYEVEDFIPVSALLSDEAAQAAKQAHDRSGWGPRDESRKWKEILQAAIQQIGGAK